MSALADLERELRREGGILAGSLRDASGHRAELGEAAAAGPRARSARPDYALVVEAVREGYLLHYGRARTLGVEEPDLALLAGDRLYAIGLERLVELGDLEAVVELADVIGLAATARAGRRPELAEAVWAAGTRAIGWGPQPGHAEAKRLAAEGDEQATDALRDVAAAVAGPPANAGR